MLTAAPESKPATSSDSYSMASMRIVAAEVARKQLRDRHGSLSDHLFRWLYPRPCEVHVERPGLCHYTSRLEGRFHR